MWTVISTRSDRRRRRRSARAGFQAARARALTFGLVTLMLSLSWPSAAQEFDDIALFKLTDVSGTFSVRYSLNDQQRYSGDSPGSFETRDTWEEELWLMTNSYVYHPGFLNMEIGGGPLLVQQQFEAQPGSNSESEALFNFLARFNFLDIKNYPVSLYIQRSHPSITTSLSGRFLTETDEYGLNGLYSSPWKGASLWANASHRESNGSGFGTVVDEAIDQFSFGLTQAYRGGDNVDFRHNHSSRQSLSGSPGLPIQESQIDTDNSEVRTRNVFGSRKQVELVQYVRHLKQETILADITELDTVAYNGNLRWDHGEDTRSSLGYRYTDVQRTETNSSSQDVIYRFADAITDRLRYEVGADFSEVEQSGFSREQPGAYASFNYSRELSFGSLGIGGSVRAERADQVSTESEIPIIDEPIVLDGTTPVDLANDFVIAETVVVTNVANTQTFVEGLDYRLVVVGSITSVQRLVDGNIADGQTVLVSYRFLSGGTAKYDSFVSGFNANLGFLNYFRTFLRLNRRQFDVVSGAPSTPLNAYRTVELGLEGDFPLWRSWSVGGQLRHTDQDEDISPQVRDSFDIHIRGEIFGLMGLSLTSSWAEVDIENSDEDVSLVNYRLGINTRFWRGTTLDYEASYLEDDGGSLLRQQTQHRLSFRWSYRQMRFALRAQLIDDRLGTTRQDYTQVTAELVRAF